MGREDYFFRRDVGKSGRGLQDVYEKSLGQQAGINKYRGIGRGAGTLAGILLAGSGAGIPLLALAGGLGSFAGSHLGASLGKRQYGEPVRAEKEGLFHRDIAKEQRESVGDYWTGMKEQIGVNTLQDAITAGMYGSQVQDVFSKGRLALGGQPAGMAIAPSVEASRAAIQQPNIAGIFPETPTRLKLPENMLKKASDIGGGIFEPSAFKSGVTTAAPSAVSQNVVSYPNVSVPPPAKIDPNALNFQQADRSAINAGRDRTKQILDYDPNAPGVQFGTDEYSAAIDANRVAISTDPTATYKPDFLNQAMGNTGGQMTPSLAGDMQQRIAYYKNRQWAPDPTIDQTMWDTWSNPQNIPDFSNIFGNNFSNYGME